MIFLYLLCDWFLVLFLILFLLSWQRACFFTLGSYGKPQRGRKATAPLHTPRAFFEEFLVVGMWSGVGLFLYALVLDVERCADVVFSASIVVNVALLTYFCMLRY